MTGAPLTEAGWSSRLRWALLGAAAVVLVVHSLAYNFVTDDAYISFAYSRNLAEHGELTFNLGERVEGYTNFLWTLVLGLGMLVGAPPEWLSRVLGTACALATLLVVFRLMERVLGRRTPWAAVPALLLATSSGFACWSSGGLETQLFTLLVAAAFDAYAAAATEPRALRRLGVLLALASMTRPEGPMIAAVFGVHWLAGALWSRLRRRRAARDDRSATAMRDGDGESASAASAGDGAEVAARREGRDALIAVAWFVGLWAPWFAWRWWYYGWPFPNTYYVKATGPWIGPNMPGEMLRNGLHYLWTWLRQTELLYALPIAVLGLVAARPRTPRFALTTACAMFAAVYLVYTVSVGGDFMGLHRFIMPLFVVAAIASTLGLEWIAGKLRTPAALRSVLRHGWGPVLAAIVVGAFAVSQWKLTRESLRWGNFASDRGIDTPAFLITYTEDRATIGRAMQRCFRPDDFSIFGGAGAQPYFARMRGVDVFGLVSERIAHDEPRIRPRAGHTKFGSDRVLTLYNPTLVFSCYRIHRTPEQPPLPCAAFWLAYGFEIVTVHIPGLRERGEYYTFLAKKSRDFQCPGRVH
jgi:arabinofuranosyltransferase